MLNLSFILAITTIGEACNQSTLSPSFVLREELKEESYTYSGQAETYKATATSESDDSDSSSMPDSPTRLLMLGGGHTKNNKGTTKDNGQMISI